MEGHFHVTRVKYFDHYMNTILISLIIMYLKSSTNAQRNLKDKKWQTFRVIHLIEFIQSNNFHIYSIF